jgi:hypothetical protein
MLSWAMSWFKKPFVPSATHCKETIPNEPAPRIKVISKMEIKGRYTLTPDELIALTLASTRQSETIDRKPSL